MPRNIRDASLMNTRALPNGAATVNSTGIDLELTSRSDFVAGAELLIEAPACNTTQLPDTQTLTYTVQHATDSGFSSPVTLFSGILQTGAGGAGAVAATKRVGIPSDVSRYVRLQIVKSGAGDATAAIATLSLVF